MTRACSSRRQRRQQLCPSSWCWSNDELRAPRPLLLPLHTRHAKGAVLSRGPTVRRCACGLCRPRQPNCGTVKTQRYVGRLARRGARCRAAWLRGARQRGEEPRKSDGGAAWQQRASSSPTVRAVPLLRRRACAAGTLTRAVWPPTGCRCPPAVYVQAYRSARHAHSTRTAPTVRPQVCCCCACCAWLAGVSARVIRAQRAPGCTRRSRCSSTPCGARGGTRARKTWRGACPLA